MGYNLQSACHKCKEQIFHFRGEENKTILPFYIKHANCAKSIKENVFTVMDNNGGDLECFYNEADGGYKEVNLEDL